MATANGHQLVPLFAPIVISTIPYYQLIPPHHIAQLLLLFMGHQTVVFASRYQETALKVLLLPLQPQLLPEQPAHNATQDSVYTGFKLDKLDADHV
jgi:hypothetical protein